MRWSCPHCGTQLAIQDEKVSSSWSFSRCYKCAGFALIRKSDTNLIKVDRAPEGEKVVLPEAHEEITGNLSRAASRNLERILNHVTTPPIKKSTPMRATPIQAKPTVRTSPPLAPPFAPPISHPFTPPLAPPPHLSTQSFAEAPAISPPPVRFPDPLPAPEVAFTVPRPPRTLQWAVAATGILAIGSGIYLYIQGQMLWEKARVRSAARSALVAPALATTSAAKPLLAGAAIDTPRLDPEIPKPEIFNHLAYTDQVHSPAMAPVRTENSTLGAATVPGAMLIQINESTANLRAGPGAEYSIVAMARPNRPYAVTEWKDRWFRIEYDPTGHKSAWIRNDLTRQVANSAATEGTSKR